MAGGVGQSDRSSVAQPAQQRVADVDADRVVALYAGLVGFVDQGAERVGDLDRPHLVGVDLRGVVEIAQQMRGAQLVDQRAERGGVVVLVAVVHDHRPGRGQVLDHERLEGVQRPIAEQVVGVELGACD